jgi:hypothetical protein
MTKEVPDDELTEHYEQISDDDLLAGWDRGEPVLIEAREPMVTMAANCRGKITSVHAGQPR